MDYGSNWWGGAAVQAPAAPSPLGLSQKYGDQTRSSGPQGNDATMMSPRDDVYDTLRYTAGDEDIAGADVARFVLSDLTNFRNQTMRALNSDDYESVRRLSESVDSFVQDHEDDLRYWEQTLAGSNDPRARGLAAELGGVLTGEYKNSWSNPNMSVRMALDDTSPEGMERRASREARRLGVDAGIAKALIDPNDPLHSAFKSYGDALVGQPGTKRAQGAAAEAKPALLANFKAAVPFVQGYMPRFGNADRTGAFLAEFDRVFNADDTVSGRGLLEDAAEGFLANVERGGRDDPTAYLSSLKEMRDLVQNGLSRKTDGATENRARMHEANSIVGAFVRDAVAAGGPVPLDSSLYADTLAVSARRVATLSSVYGIDVRQGVSGLSSVVSKMALKQLGVSGVDDKGISDFFSVVTPALDLYLGSDGKPSPKIDAKGNMVMTAPDGQLGLLENIVRQAAGKKLWEMHLTSGGSSPGTGVLQRLAADQVWQTGLKDAITGELEKALGNRSVAEKVADDVHMNILGSTHTTILQSLLRQTGKLDPDGTPAIPRDLRILASAPAATAAGVQKSQPGAVDMATLDKLIAAPEKMIPTVKGDSWKTSFVKDYVVAEKKAQRPGASDSDRYHAAEALGNLVGFGDVGGADGGVEGAMVRRAVMISAGGIEEALDKSKTAARDLRLIASRVREGDPNAILSAALIVSQAKDYEQHEFAPDPTSTPVGLEPSVSTVDTENSREYRNLRSALVSANLLTSIEDKGDIVLTSAINALGARGDLDKTILVKSGYLDPQTGVTSANRMLMKMQRDGYANPMTKTYPSIAADRPEEPTPQQKAARLALARLMPKDTLVGMEQARYREHLARQGLSESEMAPLVGAVAGELASAYEHGGAPALMNLSAKFRQRRVRFFPAPPQQSRIDGKFHLTGRVDKGLSVMTDEEADLRWNEIYQQLLDVGIDIPPFLRENTQVNGMAEWRKQSALLEAAVRAGRIEAEKQKSRNNPDQLD